MAKIAVIKTGGKQYIVSEGQEIKIEKLSGDLGQAVEFDTLLISTADGQEINLGQPLMGEKVSGKITGQGRSKKILVTKYKSKTRYLRNVGHHQQFTKVKIAKI